MLVFIIAILVISSIPGVIASTGPELVSSEENADAGADLNYDGIVNDRDKSILMAFWGTLKSERRTIAPDINGDGTVNSNDLALLLGSWGPCVREECSVDLNGDGIINNKDVKLLDAFWGLQGSQHSIKNPDINNDGVVNAADLALLLGSWGKIIKKSEKNKDDRLLPLVLDDGNDTIRCDLPRHVRIHGKNADEAMVDGVAVKPKKSHVNSVFKQKNESYRGKVNLFLQGHDENGQRIQLNYMGIIDDVNINCNVLQNDTNATLTKYEIYSYAPYVKIKKGKQSYYYGNSELMMVYDPTTEEVDVRSVTGTLMQHRNRRGSGLGNTRQELANNVTMEGMALSDTHAFGFE